MIITLLRRLVRERFRIPSTYVLFLLFFGISLMCFLTAYHQGGPLYKALGAGMNAIKVNAPYIIYSFTATAFQYCILITVYIFGRQGLRDFHNNTFQLLFTTPIEKSTYISTYFLAEMIRMLFVFSGFGFGAKVAAFFHSTSAMTAHVKGSILLPYLLNIIPNLMIFGLLAYLATLYTRKIYPVYIISAMSVILKILSELSSRIGTSTPAILLDPFGIMASKIATDTWSIAEKNSLLIAFQNGIVINRLFWLLLTGVASYLLIQKIRFAYAEGTTSKSIMAHDIEYTIIKTKKTFSFSAFWYSTLQLAIQDFKLLCKNRFFIMLTSLAVIVLLIVGFKFVGIVRNTQTYPVTYELLKIAETIFLLFVFMIIAFTSAESVWRDRELKTSHFLDTLPATSAMWTLSKILSVSMIVFFLMSLIMIVGILIQTLHGYFNYDIRQYVIMLYVIRWVQFSLIAVLSVVIQIVASKKWIGYTGVIIFYVAQDVIHDLISRHHLIGFADIMNVIYSDMNGFDIYLKRALLFNGYWTGISVFFVILGIGFWKNGYLPSFRYRCTHFFSNMNKNSAKSALAGMLCVALFGGIAYHTTTKTNIFIATTIQEQNTVTYEKTYKKYDSVAQPTITAITINAELYPSKKYCTVTGEIVLQNKTKHSLSEVFVEFPDDANNITMNLSAASKLIQHDTVNNIFIYQLDAPLEAGESVILTYTLMRQNSGIKNDGYERDIIHNGSFLYYYDITPGIGYDTNRNKEMQNNESRKKYDLTTREAYSNDPNYARKYTLISKDSDYIDLKITVGTESDQIAIAPGECKKQWTSNDRAYYEYVSDQQILKYFAILSGKYRVKKDSWNSIPIEVYYHPDHPYNIDLMIESTKQTLDYCSTHFSPYPYPKVQIVEFPRYELYAEAFPGLIPVSEGYGFIARFDPRNVEYAYRVMAHEIGHQWWAHIVTSAYYPGHQMLTEMLAQYTALMMIKKHYSQYAIDEYMKNIVKAYFKGRRHSTEYEPSMMHTTPEHSYVHYEKGIALMNALQEYIGEEQCNKALRSYYQKHARTNPPYALSTDLMEEFKNVTPAHYHYLLDEWFSNVTIYNISSQKASYATDNYGNYVVSLTYSCEKSTTSDDGEIHPIISDTHVQISIFGKNGEEYKVIRPLQNGNGKLELTIPFEPATVGLNAHYLLIEKDYQDNVVRCTNESMPTPDTSL